MLCDIREETPVPTTGRGQIVNQPGGLNRVRDLIDTTPPVSPQRGCPGAPRKTPQAATPQASRLWTRCPAPPPLSLWPQDMSVAKTVDFGVLNDDDPIEKESPKLVPQQDPEGSSPGLDEDMVEEDLFIRLKKLNIAPPTIPGLGSPGRGPGRTRGPKRKRDRTPRTSLQSPPKLGIVHPSMRAAKRPLPAFMRPAAKENRTPTRPPMPAFMRLAAKKD